VRFIQNKKFGAAQFADNERFFLDMWYGLTHARSLDLHRVQCMNARTIVRELHEELCIGRLDDPEMQGLASDCIVILQTDTIVVQRFAQASDLLRPLLEKPPILHGAAKKLKDNKEASENEERLSQLQFLVADLLAALDASYQGALAEKLSETIANGTEDDIERITGALLSDLVDRGWSLESLFSSTRHFLMRQDRTFHQNLDDMIKQLQRDPGEFEITLRVNGSDKLKEIPEFGRFALTAQAPHSGEKDEERRYMSPAPLVVFATGRFRGVDGRAASMSARDEFESLLDLFRFEYERATVEIDRRAFWVRSEDSRFELTIIDAAVPNPVEAWETADFRSFSERYHSTIHRAELAAESKNHLEAAFRLYRFGCDSDTVRDKFLDWWTGLESLANVGGLKIGRTVTQNVSHVMIHGHLARILRDMLITLKMLKIPWQDAFGELTGASGWRAVDLHSFARLFQNAQHAQAVVSTIKQHPMIKRRCHRISEWLTDPKKTREYLQQQHNRLQWHLDRLYRIRCCIVHGARVRFQLPLFAANLEYYLKQTLLFVLNALYEQPQIADLEGLFQRCQIVHKRQIERLGAKPDQQSILEVVFPNVVVQK
jgi:hypothetical protein